MTSQLQSGRDRKGGRNIAAVQQEVDKEVTEEEIQEVEEEEEVVVVFSRSGRPIKPKKRL